MQNQLMVFEKVEVEVTEINGEPMFELYSTGAALGQVKMAKGINYPRKERIDENVKNADIKPVVHNGQRWINESQLYELMLEVKTDKVRPFRKWITNEVLPSVRKTGKYETNPRQLPQPRPKYFNGEPVITIRDLAEATGIDASVIRYHLKNCRAGIHYHVLTGSELADFKAENDEASSMNHLTVITKKGFVRLAKLIGRMPNKMECFQVEKHKEALPEAKHISGKADRLINEVHCCFDAAGVIMAIMRHHPSDIDAFRKVIEYVITSALVKALEI